jgi:YVTN family beta-propeller protein
MRKAEMVVRSSYGKGLLSLLLLCLAFGCAAQKHETSALHQVGKTQLPGVEGRIDHLVIDAKDKRLFVAALENNTIEVIDLRTNKRVAEIRGLQEPQGVAYLPETGRLVITNGGGASVGIYDGRTLRHIDEIKLGEDPDNVRYDAATKRAYVGYGNGAGSALGVIDPNTDKKVAAIRLSGHPESFQLEKNGERIFVNVPTSQAIEVVNRKKGSVVATWPIKGASDNFPTALDEPDHRLFVGTRSPARLLVFDTETGKTVADLNSIGDADDIYYDGKTRRLYVSGGEGAVEVFQQKSPDDYESIGETTTAEGARTSLFVPSLRMLYVAIPNYEIPQAQVRAFGVGSGK